MLCQQLYSVCRNVILEDIWPSVTDSLGLSVPLRKKQSGKEALQGRQGTAAAGHQGNEAMRLSSRQLQAAQAVCLLEERI